MGRPMRGRYVHPTPLCSWFIPPLMTDGSADCADCADWSRDIRFVRIGLRTGSLCRSVHFRLVVAHNTVSLAEALSPPKEKDGCRLFSAAFVSFVVQNLPGFSAGSASLREIFFPG